MIFTIEYYSTWLIKLKSQMNQVLIPSIFFCYFYISKSPLPLLKYLYSTLMYVQFHRKKKKFSLNLNGLIRKWNTNNIHVIYVHMYLVLYGVSNLWNSHYQTCVVLGAQMFTSLKAGLRQDINRSFVLIISSAFMEGRKWSVDDEALEIFWILFWILN